MLATHSFLRDSRHRKGNNFMNNIVMSPNIKKVSERIDTKGNVINPVTKQVIVPNVIEEINQEDMTPKVVTPQPVIPSSSPLSIQQQIDEAKANLVKLEELKKLKIAEMRAQLELLES
jgi:hypothetical protein